MPGADCLAGLIRRYSPPAFPLPARGSLPAAGGASGAGIRAYLFDVYGTLFTSDSGDIGILASQAGERAEDGRARELLAPFGPGASLPDLARRFSAAVTAEHERLRGKTAWPEIDVRKIWANILRVPEEAAAEFSLRFELAVNPVYPMPGLADMLRKLRAAGFPLGLVSNAQFFTPLLFMAFLGGPPDALGFSPDLCVYSFREGEAKPSPGLFRKAAASLAALGIRPEEAVYAGNDMLNDMWAAKQAGFRAALFAGDGRSLRLRGDDPRCAGLKPDFVLRSLADIPT
ncbi:MAG: HAD family hydrolase [Spirochaetia bacterium]|jgi:putative hydrolase of the HAD superfamily|nr:HAD family hydrolase [Spirochaetia bacterium]